MIRRLLLIDDDVSLVRILSAALAEEAVVYDTMHLDGALRVVVLGIAGFFLLGGAWLVRSSARSRV